MKAKSLIQDSSHIMSLKCLFLVIKNFAISHIKSKCSIAFAKYEVCLMEHDAHDRYFDKVVLILHDLLL